MKKHVIHERMPDAPHAYLSNGVIGLRAGRNPLRELTGLLNGFSGIQELHGMEAYAPIPCPLMDVITGSSQAEGSRSMLSGPAERFVLQDQTYDFSCGELITRFVYHPADGRDIACEHTLLCSRTSPTLYLISLRMTATQDINTTVSVRFDASSLPVETCQALKTHDCDGMMLLAGRGRPEAGQAGIAYMTRWDGKGERWQRSFLDYETESLETRVQLQLCAGVPQTVRLIVSCVPGALHSEPHQQAVRMIKLAQWEGFDVLREKNRAAWAEIWKGRITVSSDDARWQDWLDSAYFYLHSSMHTSSPFSIAPCGLGNRFLYKGHVFWDTESFMFLLPLLTAPHVAEAMLDYRFDRLDAARNNARIHGYRGIQFPWQSFASGDEVTRCSARGGAGEQHVNLDVALAFALYARMADDPVFIRERAWPVLRGVSQWIESRVTRTERGYEILHVTGIDEERDNVNNNAYTNILSAKVLREANAVGIFLGYPENRLWKDIADGLFIPYDEEHGYLQQFEDAPLQDVLTCEAVMTYFPYGYRRSDESDKNTLRTYVTHGMEEQLHYPMLSGFLGVFPAWLGDREASARYFEKATKPFLREPYMISVEWASRSESDPDNMPTPFLTGRASLLSGVILGLTRLNLWADEDSWLEGPIVLPRGLHEIVLQRIYLKGRPARIIARHGDAHAQIEWLSE